MPIHLGKNNDSYYYQYGSHGTKYYFDSNNQKSHDNAYIKAMKQAVAIMYSGYKEKRRSNSI
jgi:hypothetical protein